MPPTVLIVDDSESNRYLLTLLLGEAGLHVLPVASGREALTLAEKYPPALVLLDLQMPELDGFETAHLLQALPLMHGVPIVAVTATVSSSTRERVRLAGFAGYFAKPINPDTFLQESLRYINPPSP
ncbi:MAG: response regulator [Opitutaceae bacterium]|nr:response regulator [Opitutaceae bacterium]